MVQFLINNGSNKNLISVIVPVYNVELLLDRCVSSITNQTFTNLEIILVDDGSTDGSGMICDLWSDKDTRVKVIHKKNGGLASARNAGLVLASGNYISFVDSDDWISPEMLRILYEKINLNNADIAVCNYYVAKSECEYYAGQLFKDRIYEGYQALKQAMIDNLPHTVWCKLVQRQVLENEDKQLDAFFIEQRYEDTCYSLREYFKAKKIVVTSERLYYYYSNSDSITSVPKDSDFIDIENNILYVSKYLSMVVPKEIFDCFAVITLIFMLQLSFTKGDDYRSRIITHRINEKIKKLPMNVILKSKAWKRLIIAKLHLIHFFFKIRYRN
ncbi:MAG: glycosyltransferase [Candidatus Treponema excrementipullorum]|uniref:Glycosyltransferase n=1 Tax=Candidatus Treponema excrementipullorum TaxID=2838768 RepID=A0A9E2L1H9_9SPIR|nr:glycosyltransferase [Candidatus Treponema excrementipullorum]